MAFCISKSTLNPKQMLFKVEILKIKVRSINYKVNFSGKNFYEKLKK